LAALVEPELEGEELHEKPEAAAVVSGKVEAEGVFAEDLVEDVQSLGIGGGPKRLDHAAVADVVVPV
jgi:hypothetical protein